MKKILAVLSVLSLLAFAAPAFADSNVTAAPGTGTSITPAGITVVPTGVVQTFGIGVSQGFNLSDVSVDGISAGTPSFVDITGDATDHTITTSANAVVTGGGSLPWCSNPMAPGWNTSLPDGGCGGTSVFVHFGAPIFQGAAVAGQIGTVTTCVFLQGCMVPKSK